MVEIDVCVEAQHDLTTFTVQGELTFDDVIRLIHENYNESSTGLILWDGRGVTVSSITVDEFHKVAYLMKGYAEYRSGGKTAFVGAEIIDYGLGRMYETLVHVEGVPCEYRTFYTVHEAREWLLDGWS